jgi:hypothetical protein
MLIIEIYLTIFWGGDIIPEPEIYLTNFFGGAVCVFFGSVSFVICGLTMQCERLPRSRWPRFAKDA